MDEIKFTKRTIDSRSGYKKLEEALNLYTEKSKVEKDSKFKALFSFEI